MDLYCEERPSDSPLIENVWRGTGTEAAAFISVASSRSSIVVTRIHGRTYLTIRGPETIPTPAFSPPDAEFFGMMFSPYAFLPKFPPRTVMDRRDVNLPHAAGEKFWLDGSAWQFPSFENADTFANRLVKAGLLILDPVVKSALHGHPLKDMSLRSIQRRFIQTTGLTQTTLYQIDRARYATDLLRQGVPILDVVFRAGYFDQPHLTRSVKRFTGLTPSQIADPNRTARLSFLYKTSSIPMNYDEAI